MQKNNLNLERNDFMSLNESNVINGKYGRVWVGGYEMMMVESFELKRKIDREVIKGTGKRANRKVYKLKDTEISGKLKVKRIDNMGIREYNKQLDKGIDEPVVIEVSLEDPNQYNNEQETISFEAYLEGDLDLLSFENEKYSDIEISFYVNPATLDWNSIIDGNRQDMLAK